MTRGEAGIVRVNHGASTSEKHADDRVCPRRLVSRAGLLVLITCASLLASAGVASAGFPSPPFNQCPPVGQDTSCATLITVNPDGSLSASNDPTQLPFDGDDDTLVGVENRSSSTVFSIELFGEGEEDIFGFDGDGLCAGYEPGPAGCPFGETGYEGPGTSFTAVSESEGTVNFIGGLAPGESRYFSLEGPITLKCSKTRCGGSSEQKPTTLTTSLSAGSQTGESISVSEGTAVTDHAALAGENALTAEGQVEYFVFSDSECQHFVAFAGTVSVSGGVIPASNAQTLPPGTYYWQAEYTGDIHNHASHSTCGSEVETVKTTPPPPPPSKIELGQASGGEHAGGAFSLTATASEAGAPDVGVPITFKVVGANPQTVSVVTNAAGQATFTYTGVQLGTDHIVASFVNKKGETVISSEATHTWVALPAPVLGKTVNVEVVKGIVLIELPAGAQLSSEQPLAVESVSKGVGFVPLTEARQIPVGSTLDTTRGVARLTTATASSTISQFGEFGAGIFTILQNRKQRGLSELRIVNNQSSRRVCATVGKKGAFISRHLSKKVLGRLEATAHGKFTTRGQYSAATVRGTVWSVSNQCNGTLTVVKRGVVAVRDFIRRKTITLFTGQHYLAKAP